MQYILNTAEDFRLVHEAFEQINFNAFDFNTIKASLIEYLRLFYPEDFNDYIESSEIISIIESFAYVGELIAYRLDLNTHENFFTLAEKKESILRLSRLISFNASRRQSARGLVRIDAISTTEEVRDSLNTRSDLSIHIAWRQGITADSFYAVIDGDGTGQLHDSTFGNTVGQVFIR